MRTDRVVLITGSNTGIGRGAALAFAREGWKIALTYRSKAEEAEAVAEECRTAGALDVLVQKLDVTDGLEIERAVRRAIERFGRIDVLVNNAGTVAGGPLEEQTIDDIEDQVWTNLVGPIKLTQACLPHGIGVVVNLGSEAAKDGRAGLTTYSATKFGMRGFTQALAREREDIKAYCVNPTWTATRMTGGRGMPPEDVGRVILSAVKGEYKVPSGGDVDVWEVLPEG